MNVHDEDRQLKASGQPLHEQQDDCMRYKLPGRTGLNVSLLDTQVQVGEEDMGEVQA